MKAILKYTDCLHDGNMLIQKLNDACLYGVEVVKVNTINYSVIVIEYLLLFLCFFMLFEILCFVK